MVRLCHHEGVSSFVNTSIADIPEGSLIKELLADIYWRATLSNLAGIDEGSVPLPQVPLTDLGQGDIDILLVAPGRTSTPTAVQVKRIKVGPRALRTEKPNRLRELEEGKRQANLLAEIGFWQVYLYVFLVVDSREQNAKEIAAGRISYDGMGQPLRSAVLQALSPLGLDPRVGFMHWEFTQPMDHKALTMGAYGGDLVRLAQPLEQSARVTEWVSKTYSART